MIVTKTYKDVDGWFGFVEFYKHIGETFLKNDMHVLEMGVFDGKSICYLANIIKERKLKIFLFAVDHWIKDEDYLRFKNNLIDCGISELVTIIRMPSNKAALLFPSNHFDFIFIDGAHDYESVREDLNLWTPKVKPGGIIAGDDYDPCWPGVIKAVDQKFGENVKKQWPVWYINI